MYNVELNHISVEFRIKLNAPKIIIEINSIISRLRKETETPSTFMDNNTPNIINTVARVNPRTTLYILKGTKSANTMPLNARTFLINIFYNMIFYYCMDISYKFIKINFFYISNL